MTGPGPVAEVTASAIVFNHDLRRVCLVRHRRLGFWIYPGGHVVPGEDLEECVLREVREETGLSVELQPCGRPAEPRVANARVRSLTAPLALLRIDDADRGPYTDVVFVALADDADVLRPRRHEVDEVRWVGVGDLPADEMPPELPGLILGARRCIGDAESEA